MKTNLISDRFGLLCFYVSVFILFYFILFYFIRILFLLLGGGDGKKERGFE